jgi:hypothetical protein
LLAALRVLVMAPCTAMPRSEAVSLDGVVFQGQCNGRAHGAILSQAASWSPPIFIDTDSRLGGCLFRIGIVDPSGALRAAGFGLTMIFTADGDPG